MNSFQFLQRTFLNVILADQLHYLPRVLFSQVGKVMERAEERGWFYQERNWTGSLQNDAADAKDRQTDTSPIHVEASQLHIADESKPKCAVCGVLFKMVFDNDHGEWMYKDCREVEVLNDDAAEEESDFMLVHFTCWQKVGSPELLTKDQIL
jgi:hypothetical protein